MSTSVPVSENLKHPHWIVLTNYRMRTASFAMSFAFIGAHLAGKDYSPLVWSLLALQFLIYPHLVYWRARRAPDSKKTEQNNLVLDSLLFGLWVAALQFPLWIAFTLFISSSINSAISQGARGILLALVAFSSGVLISIAHFGLHVSAQTGWVSTLLCVIGLTVYLLVIGGIAYGNEQRRRTTREQLRRGEKALLSANGELQQQLSEIHALQAQLREQASRDPLTGLYNRRYLDATLGRELARCERERQNLSLILIDIDYFKQINDRYGHQAGDEVIKKVASMLNQQARAADVACRYGGEEFLLLLPNMPRAIALERAEQWRSAVAETTVLFQEFCLQATVSVGIAIYPDHGQSPEELIRCADVALYRAKSEGRNRVVLFEPELAVTRA